MRVVPIKPTLKVPGTNRLKVEYDKSMTISLQFCLQFCINFAVSFNLRRYFLACRMGALLGRGVVGATRHIHRLPWVRGSFHLAGVEARLCSQFHQAAAFQRAPRCLAGVIHWLRKGGHPVDPVDKLVEYRRESLEGAEYCVNSGCEVVGHLKDFKVCPQCKTARYCGDACQKEDWTTGGHKVTCGAASRF